MLLVLRLDANLHGDRQRYSGVGGADRQGKLQSVGARNQARVERRQKELLIGVVDGEGHIQRSGVLDGRCRLVDSFRLGRIEVHVRAGVARVTTSSRNLLLLPRDLVQRQCEQVVGGDVVEARVAAV